MAAISMTNLKFAYGLQLVSNYIYPSKIWISRIGPWFLDWFFYIIYVVCVLSLRRMRKEISQNSLNIPMF